LTLPRLDHHCPGRALCAQNAQARWNRPTEVNSVSFTHVYLPQLVREHKPENVKRPVCIVTYEPFDDDGLEYHSNAAVEPLVD